MRLQAGKQPCCGQANSNRANRRAPYRRLISNGWAAPSAARTAATVVGMSWIDVVLSTTNVNTSSGVPAAPYSPYQPLSGTQANRRRRIAQPHQIRRDIGRNAFHGLCVLRGTRKQRAQNRAQQDCQPLQMPDFCISSRIPDHNPMTPTSARQSVTACSVPCVTAADSSAVLPVMQAVAQARIIMPAHKPFIMRFTPFSRRCSAFFLSYHLYLNYVFSMEEYYYYEINRNCPQS